LPTAGAAGRPESAIHRATAATERQGKEKQRDCLLFLFLVLQFASDVFFVVVIFRPFRPDDVRVSKGVLGVFLFFASPTEIFANVPGISVSLYELLRLQRKAFADVV
jgi:hypothetical protein